MGLEVVRSLARAWLRGCAAVHRNTGGNGKCLLDGPTEMAASSAYSETLDSFLSPVLSSLNK